METIGEFLKRVRETCGYSLEDVAGITKINLRYLEAIDLDDFDKLPGETFYQGFIRSYAKCVGISEEEISRRIRETPRAEQPPAAHTQNQEKKAVQNTVNKPGKARVILPAAVGVILVVLLLILFSGGRDNETIRNSKELNELNEVKELKELKEFQEFRELEEKTEVPVESSEVKQQVEQASAEPLVLKIYARELTWIKVRIDDKETKEALLKPGEGVMWNGESQMIITAGNAGGIDLDVNGKTVGPLGRRGEVVRDRVITSKGIIKPEQSVEEGN